MKLRKTQLHQSAFLRDSAKKFPAARRNVLQLLKTHRVEGVSSTYVDYWAAVSLVPCGYVATYTTIARVVLTVVRATSSSSCASSPVSYARLAGNSMARNPLAPLIPCHRAVGANGSLTGYQHGLEKKAALLRSEGVPVQELSSQKKGFCVLLASGRVL